jgi:hypothetical protein
LNDFGKSINFITIEENKGQNVIYGAVKQEWFERGVWLSGGGGVGDVEGVWGGRNSNEGYYC